MTHRNVILILLTLSLLGCDREPPPATVDAPETSEAPAGNGDHAHEAPTTPTNEAVGDNPVRHEMQLLTVAMKNSLDAIANDQLDRIPGEIAKVHPAKMKTEAALKAGTYTPPFGADKMDEFAERDEVFHDQLRALLGAAKANDTRAAAATYGDLVQGCADCHATYRFGPR